MKRLFAISAAILAAALISVPTASAAFGLSGFDVSFTNEDGSPVTQAGAHPYAMTTKFEVNSEPHPNGGTVVQEPIRTLEIDQVVGLAGNPTAVPPCETKDFLVGFGVKTACADGSAVGTLRVTLGGDGNAGSAFAPVYNLVPPPGAAARLGFKVGSVPTTVNIGVGEGVAPRIVAAVRNFSQALEVVESELTLWGVPADPRHDPIRGNCRGEAGESAGECPTKLTPEPFLTLPRACEGPIATDWRAESWLNPGAWVSGEALTHDAVGNPQGLGGCGKLDFNPGLSAQPTSRSAESPTGLDVEVAIDDEGLTNSTGIAASDIKKTVLTLPEGVTANPSQAEGLGVCTETDFARERAGSPFGAGCPGSSKIGTVEVETPLLEGRTLRGSLFIAEPYENRFGSLIALFMTIKEPELGINVGLAVKVEPDPDTGQLVSTVENIPQLPVSRFRLHFREGGRSPLVTPPACGTYETKAVFTPWADPDSTFTATASFEVTSGIGGGPCPPGGVPPFSPDFQAGSQNNSAGSYSPFYMRLLRADGEQDLTKFSAVLPRGVLGKLAGLGKCPEAAIAAAADRSGREELAFPSCPVGSEIGRVLAGAGVGGSLTYVPGKIYLAGPYNGAPLSVAVITPAVAGPFDVGTIVVREALDLDPATAEVRVDGAASDPIPHILAGIPLKVRDIRVYVDRPGFILNPTSCDPSSARATLFGGFLDVFSAADDVPVDRATRFQAASCLNLGMKPRLALNLEGGTRRGDFPALRATYRPRPGDANLERFEVRLPHSAFLEQGHIGTICTRVQFAAETCPAAAQYGYVRAWTPLLEEPLQGPVYLRSSNNPLPDLVFDLEGLVDVEVAARIDSVKGGIRARILSAPDAPLSKVVLTMRGGRKGLIVNSRNLCLAPSRANVVFGAHNGKQLKRKLALRAVACGKKGRKAESDGRGGRGRR